MDEHSPPVGRFQTCGSSPLPSWLPPGNTSGAIVTSAPAPWPPFTARDEPADRRRCPRVEQLLSRGPSAPMSRHAKRNLKIVGPWLARAAATVLERMAAASPAVAAHPRIELVLGPTGAFHGDTKSQGRPAARRCVGRPTLRARRPTRWPDATAAPSKVVPVVIAILQSGCPTKSVLLRRPCAAGPPGRASRRRRSRAAVRRAPRGADADASGSCRARARSSPRGDCHCAGAGRDGTIRTRSAWKASSPSSKRTTSPSRA